MNSDLDSAQTNSPGGSNRTEAARILEDVSGATSLVVRIDLISKRLIGRPYVESPLGGGPALSEKLTASIDGFDCVTYIETVLALALSDSVEGFLGALREMRYEDGRVDWFHRNHYMIDWARRNEERGLVARLSEADAVEKTCLLEVVAGLPAKTVTFRYFPKESLSKVESIVGTGDLILFVSKKSTLDVFHTGILVAGRGATLMRHATRTAGAVIEQPVLDFVNSNELAGVILLRPLCRR